MIYIVTHKGFFGQGLMPWEGVDVFNLYHNLTSYGLTLKMVELSDLENINDASLIITGSFQQLEIKKVLEDKLFYLMNQGCKILPNFDLVLAHENKGYQSLLKKKYKIDELNEKYLTSDSLYFKSNYVYKDPNGAGSHGVILPENSQALYKWSKKISFDSLRVEGVKKILKLVFKKFFLFGWRYSSLRVRYLKSPKGIVVQELIPELTFDYKVLIFGERFYVLKRHVRKGDFRASGSGNFESVTNVEPQVLIACKLLKEKLSTPYLSVDIGYDGNKAYIIEFQGPHFGPYTYLSSKCYFKLGHDGSVKSFLQEESETLEGILARSIYQYIKDENESFSPCL
ncbi:hypothetical protein AB4161_20845 [Vibrio sp. 10N.286.51.E5]|uniref:hypothetical protein n=1 Tax=Vibrio sp. 10N.286.51.E5 TaxID=3229709 RepID=UPI00355447D2